MKVPLLRLLPAALVAGCGGASHSEPDAGADASADATDDAEVPRGCEDFVRDGDRACIPSGRFWFGRISDDESDPPEPPECYFQGGFLYAVNSCAHEIDLPAFEIDLREVSVAEYAEAVLAGVVPAPPELCESAGNVVEDSDCDLEIFGRTGFDGSGQPLADSLETPVGCVRKAEARLYCGWRGGRLPMSTEWMKAARGASPSRREIPWAEGVPLPFSKWNDLPLGDFVFREAGEPTCEDIGGVPRESVTSRPENASPYGLLHVLGNVREWVETAASGDLYEDERVDVLGFGEVRESSRLYSPDSPRISVGVPAEVGVPGQLLPVERDHTLGFRCAYDR